MTFYKTNINKLNDLINITTLPIYRGISLPTTPNSTPGIITVKYCLIYEYTLLIL